MVTQKLIVDDQGYFEVTLKSQASHQVIKFVPAKMSGANVTLEAVVLPIIIHVDDESGLQEFLAYRGFGVRGQVLGIDYIRFKVLDHAPVMDHGFPGILRIPRN